MWIVLGKQKFARSAVTLYRPVVPSRSATFPHYVSDMELGKVEIRAEILLRISQEFGKTIEWLLTGE
jgi:hypothetical protein